MHLHIGMDKCGQKYSQNWTDKWSVGTYARPQDYALDPQPDEGEKRPECEMNAEEERVFMMRTTYLIVNL